MARLIKHTIKHQAATNAPVTIPYNSTEKLDTYRFWVVLNDLVLSSLRFVGRRRNVTFQDYIEKHQEAHAELEYLEEAVPPSKKVTDFLNGIEMWKVSCQTNGKYVTEQSRGHPRFRQLKVDLGVCLPTSGQAQRDHETPAASTVSDLGMGGVSQNPSHSSPAARQLEFDGVASHAQVSGNDSSTFDPKNLHEI